MPHSENRPPHTLRCSPSEEKSPSPAEQPQDKPSQSYRDATAGSHYPLLATRYSLLLSYFRSGWAFLIPYLTAYLLYAWLKWPVNPAHGGDGIVKVASESVTAINSQLSTLSSQPSPLLRPPCLLHVYWFLHALHLGLGAITLRTWWRTPTCSALNSQLSAAANPSLRDRLWSLIPWLCLALTFWIPGVYLEWPSDPWEHLRRINEWRILDTVMAHSSWMKSSYFIPYSLLSWTMGLRQLYWLDFYYTSICLLLCWQYYKLSRACGLGERSSMVFVIIQALLFGNNIFSFYRYYGISSSIYAQLGAVALTRIVLEFAARGTKLDPRLSHKKAQKDAKEPEHQTGLQKETKSSTLTAQFPLGAGAASVPISNSQCLKTGPENFTTDRTDKHGLTHVQTDKKSDPLNAKNTKADLPTQSSKSTCCSLPTTRYPLLANTPLAPGDATPPPYSLLATRYSLLISVPALIALTALNHPQGIGIAGLGIAAVIVWRLIEWKRSAVWGLFAGIFVINALFLWLYPRPAIIETYRSQGWLNTWYGFNLIDLSSAAGDRMMQIVSAFGLVNLAAALYVLRGNQVIAWLTITPLLALILPCVSVPLCNALSTHDDAFNIITFQRMLFAIPIGMAVVCLGKRLTCGSAVGPFVDYRSPSRTFFACGALVVMFAVEPARPSYNRTWQAIYTAPDDLQLLHVVKIVGSPALHQTSSQKLITSFGNGMPLQALSVPNIIHAWRGIGAPVSDLTGPSITSTKFAPNDGTIVFVPSRTQMFTPGSLSGFLSTHWPPQQLACDNAGAEELIAEAVRRGGVKIISPTGSVYKFGPDKPP